MHDYIPRNDVDFNLWQANLVDITDSQLTAWGINADDFTKLLAAQTTWNTAFADANIVKDRSGAEVKAKDDARAAYETELREFYMEWLANNHRVSNKDRERMMVTVKSDSRTPVPKPLTAPKGTVDFSTRLQHTLHWVDADTPTRKAKPAGVHGCEIWSKIDGPAPVEPSDLVYVATSTRASYTTIFEGKTVGKTVWYWLRWVNMRGEFGPWSRTFSATVAG